METHKSVKEEIVIISDSDEPNQPALKIKKKKNTRKEKTREVSIGTVNSNTETLIIKQKVKIKKQKIQCVINIEQGDRKYKKERKSSILRGRNLLWPSKNVKREIRIVPMCLRRRCRYERMNECHCSARKEENNNTKLLLSPISSSSLQDSSLDAVNSDDSFVFYSSDDDLDRLIRRTKKRDILFNENRFLIQGYSTPMNSIDIEDEKTVIIGDANMSLNSKATLILEAFECGTYSPTISNWTNKSEQDYLLSKSNVDSRSQHELFDNFPLCTKDETPCIQHLNDYKVDVRQLNCDIKVEQSDRSAPRYDTNTDRGILKIYNQHKYSLNKGYTGDIPILQEHWTTKGTTIEPFYIKTCIENTEREIKHETTDTYFKQDIDDVDIKKNKIENPIVSKDFFDNINLIKTENIKNKIPLNITNQIKLENPIHGEDGLDDINLITKDNIKNEKPFNITNQIKLENPNNGEDGLDNIGLITEDNIKNEKLFNITNQIKLENPNNGEDGLDNIDLITENNIKNEKPLNVESYHS